MQHVQFVSSTHSTYVHSRDRWLRRIYNKLTFFSKFFLLLLRFFQSSINTFTRDSLVCLSVANHHLLLFIIQRKTWLAERHVVSRPAPPAAATPPDGDSVGSSVAGAGSSSKEALTLRAFGGEKKQNKKNCARKQLRLQTVEPARAAHRSRWRTGKCTRYRRVMAHRLYRGARCMFQKYSCWSSRRDVKVTCVKGTLRTWTRLVLLVCLMERDREADAALFMTDNVNSWLSSSQRESESALMDMYADPDWWEVVSGCSQRAKAKLDNTTDEGQGMHKHLTTVNTNSR